ncbi:MAG TPA: hypothetical protein VKR79_06935 [Gaiellaceae bacterium]|nr:hypothetical protein [Gaiellaceae bacterium]
MQTVRRLAPFALVLACALAAATPALALPHFDKAQTREISTLVNRLVNDLVRRENLADGWKIAGPPERGAITRKAWLSGRELPVQQMDVLNDPRTAWYAKWKDGDEIGLVLSLRTGHGANAEMYQAETVLAKLRHRGWVVNAFYVDGIFRLGKGHSGSCVSASCKVTGLADYWAGGGGSVGSAKPRIGGMLLVGGVIAIGLLIVGIPLGFVLRARSRYRRARAAYLASRLF